MAFLRNLFARRRERSAAEQNTSDAAAWLEQASALLADNRPKEALEILDGAPSRGRTEGWRLLLKARATRLVGEPAVALTLCEAALSHDWNAAETQLELAECHRALHDLHSALDALAVATSLDPRSGRAWTAMGEVLLKLERPEEARDALVAAIDCLEDPRALASARFHLGQAYGELGLIQDAAHNYRACIALSPELVGPHIALGHALIKDDDELAALACYERALQLSPAVWENVRLNMAIAMVNIGRYEEARRHLDSALAARPADHTARWYLSQLDLLECRWEAGWSNFGARFRAGSSPYRPMPYAPWQGQALEEEPLLVLADQGLGDEIMFASCFEDVRTRVRHCIVECEPRLQRLFERSFPSFTFVSTRRENDTAWLRGLPEPRWQIPASDLPVLFRRREEDFPEHRRSFLIADPDRTQAWSERLRAVAGHGLRVGISWRGGITGTRTKARSLDVAQWGPILRTPGVTFFNLQYGAYQDDLSRLELEHGVKVHDYPDAIADYDETAAFVSSLDLVVSVCTAVVHLGGALGTPVWVLTPFAPGWRYTAHRDSMPWYPSTRIFRQDSAGDWQSACQKLSHQLGRLTKPVNS